MTVLVEQGDAAAIIAPSGKLDATSAPELERCAGGLLEEGARRFVIDCRNVESISSAGLGGGRSLPDRSLSLAVGFGMTG